MHDQEASLTLYGIKNCDTIKKARRWLDDRQLAYRFHDYRVDGVDAGLLRRFMAQAGWQTLLNTRGVTWRRLDEQRRAQVNDVESALQLMLEQPAVIKRPVLLRDDGELRVGFDPEQYRSFTVQEV
ncbi:ArsC family reductase [Martelella alba]|uniref:ArsC family reductase n=1 Tax=Martelella alba TaxID=2590451 RepID=A0ABY2SNI1_9HYPH|nr:ArsC family reductase [Martelella alba]TKI06662.1 ArsC family reductase [Martelella alba]